MAIISTTTKAIIIPMYSLSFCVMSLLSSFEASDLINPPLPVDSLLLRYRGLWLSIVEIGFAVESE